MVGVADKHKERARSSFDRQAGSYDQARWGDHARAIYSHALERLGCLTYRSLLDVGCGTGAVLSTLAERDQEGKVFAGIDLSPRMIEVARGKLAERADLRVGDAECLPWPDRAFDAVLCLDSFHHYPNPGRALSEMRRVTSPSGRLVLEDCWCAAPFRRVINLLLPFSKEGDVRIHSESEIRNLLRESGFVDIEWSRVNPRSCLVVARPA